MDWGMGIIDSPLRRELLGGAFAMLGLACHGDETNNLKLGNMDPIPAKMVSFTDENPG